VINPNSFAKRANWRVVRGSRSGIDRVSDGSSESRPLRVIVTRAAERAAGLSQLLRDAGHEVVEVPVTTTTEPSDGGVAFDRAMGRLHEYDWLVVTSPEGARRVVERAERIGVDPRRVKRAAVGTSTAATLGGADLVPEVQTGSSLGSVFPIGDGRVLLAVAESASTSFEESAHVKGWTVDRVHSYRTVPVVPHDVDARLVSECDAITFTAASSVEAWVAAFGTATPRRVVAMGPQTADALRRAGIDSFVVAAEQSLAGIVRALA
jgi:uroporphyrinogen III methyltransferase/synthase